MMFKDNSGLGISSKVYNDEKDGDVKLNNIKAGIVAQTISMKFE